MAFRSHARFCPPCRAERERLQRIRLHREARRKRRAAAEKQIQRIVAKPGWPNLPSDAFANYRYSRLHSTGGRQDDARASWER